MSVKSRLVLSISLWMLRLFISARAASLSRVKCCSNDGPNCIFNRSPLTVNLSGDSIFRFFGKVRACGVLDQKEVEALFLLNCCIGCCCGGEFGLDTSKNDFDF